MNEWFECKVRYDKPQGDGSIKQTTELYLVEGLSFSEAENTVIEELNPFISGEFMVDTMKRAKYADIFTSEDAASDRYFRIRVSFIIIDENGQKYVTGSKSFWSSFRGIYDEMNGSDEEWGIKIFSSPSKNYKGKSFITCSLV